MNICLFIFIFLFHFVSNKERFFLKINNIKYEYALNTADDGISFYKELKERKTIKLEKFSGTNLSFNGNMKINGPLNFISDNENNPKKGEIIIHFEDNEYTLFMYINGDQKFSALGVNPFVRVGNIIPSDKFDELINSLGENRQYFDNSEVLIEGEEKYDTPKENIEIIEKSQSTEKIQNCEKPEKIERTEKLRN